jgi:hypothetical protein
MPGNLQNRLYILFPPTVVSLTTTHFSLLLLLLLLHSHRSENLKSLSLLDESVRPPQNATATAGSAVQITSRSWSRGSGEGEVFVIPIPAVIIHPLSCHFAWEWAKGFAASGIDAFSCPCSCDSCLAVPQTMLISLAPRSSLLPSSHFFQPQSNLSTFYTWSAFKLLRVSVL